jgi:hypothetical protein
MTDFDTMCGHHGFRSCPIIGGLNPYIEWFRSLVQPRIDVGKIDGKPMRLEIGFVDDPTYNAWACTSQDGVDFIGINAGVIEILPSLYRALLSHPQVFSEILTPNIVPKISPYQGNVADFWSAEKLPADVPLDDPAREKFAQQLAQETLLYIFFHEFAHIYNGHTLLDPDVSMMSEVEHKSSNRMDKLTEQTLEYDADSSAVQNLLAYVLRPMVDSSKLPSRWKLPDETPFGSISSSVKFALMCIQTNHLMSSKLSEIFNASSLYNSHPPDLIRQIYTLSTVQAQLTLRAGYSSTDAISLTIPGISAAVGGFRQCFGIDSSYVVADSNSIPKKFDEFSHLYKLRWQKIHPVLEKKKRGGFLAPATPYV